MTRDAISQGSLTTSFELPPDSCHHDLFLTGQTIRASVHAERPGQAAQHYIPKELDSSIQLILNPVKMWVRRPSSVECSPVIPMAQLVRMLGAFLPPQGSGCPTSES